MKESKKKKKDGEAKKVEKINSFDFWLKLRP